MTHRIIPAGGSHGSTSSQATGPSRGQGSGYRNNPGIGVIPVGVGRVDVPEVGGQHGAMRRRCPRLARCQSDEGLDGKAVSQVMDARVDGGGCGCRGQPGDLPEDLVSPPRCDPGPPGAGHEERRPRGGDTAGRAGRVARSAGVTVGCSGTSRERSNFACRTVTTPASRSTSSRISAVASPMRMPVAASSPKTASWVAARSGGAAAGRAQDPAISPGCTGRERAGAAGPGTAPAAAPRGPGRWRAGSGRSRGRRQAAPSGSVGPRVAEPRSIARSTGDGPGPAGGVQVGRQLGQQLPGAPSLKPSPGADAGSPPVPGQRVHRCRSGRPGPARARSRSTSTRP